MGGVGAIAVTHLLAASDEPLTQAQIVEQTGLTQASVSRIL